jgi:hypothetical protein
MGYIENRRQAMAQTRFATAHRTAAGYLLTSACGKPMPLFFKRVEIDRIGGSCQRTKGTECIYRY